MMAHPSMQVESLGFPDLQVPSKTAIATTHFDLLSRLASAGAPDEVAAAIVRFARELPECESAIAAWALDSSDEPRTSPEMPLSSAQIDFMRSALAQGHPVFSPSG